MNEEHLKWQNVNKILDNQSKIDQLLSVVYKNEKGGDRRLEKKEYLKDWKAEELKVKQGFGLKMLAVQQGKDPKTFAEEYKKRMTMDDAKK